MRQIDRNQSSLVSWTWRARTVHVVIRVAHINATDDLPVDVEKRAIVNENVGHHTAHARRISVKLERPGEIRGTWLGATRWIEPDIQLGRGGILVVDPAVTEEAGPSAERRPVI